MGVVPSHPESQALGMRRSISASSTEAQSTPLPARCDHLVIVAGVNVPRPSQLVAWPLIGDR